VKSTAREDELVCVTLDAFESEFLLVKVMAEWTMNSCSAREKRS